MITFSNKWKTSCWIALIFQTTWYYYYPLGFVSVISFKQCDSIFVDATHDVPPSQLVENKLIVWLLFLAKADRRSKKGWETRFWRAHGRAVNVLSFTCSLFLESKTHVQPKFKWHNLTLSGISPRKKNVHELPPEHQSANLPKELFWIIIVPLVWNTRWNWGNLRFAWLNANHLCFCSPLKVTKRCGVHLKSAPGPSLRHVGLKILSYYQKLK